MTAATTTPTPSSQNFAAHTGTAPLEASSSRVVRHRLSRAEDRSRIRSAKGFTATSHNFVMDWASVWVDIVVGLLIAGALGAWVPERFWQGFFLIDHPLLAKLWGPLVGPIVAVVSFVCSVGDVPLAACCGTAASASAG
jgi:uncharacterized membrane protein YraQ (UPF0718 family)